LLVARVYTSLDHLKLKNARVQIDSGASNRIVSTSKIAKMSERRNSMHLEFWEHNDISWIVESYFAAKAKKDSEKSENVNNLKFSNWHSSHEIEMEGETSDSDHE